jgi:phosphoglycolate phosphatase
VISTILFDLDGTLIDTAPDMAYSLNLLLQENGHQIMHYTTIRPHVSNGSAALVKLAFGENIDPAYLEQLKKRYLEIYQQHLCVHSALFEGMQELLESIEKSGKKWGVVTNKPSWLTEPLMEALNLTRRSACIVSGDTTPERKPHPAPMIYACNQAGSETHECLYVGDAHRDIAAGKNANMKTIIASYGYIGDWESPQDWGADAAIDHPMALLTYLN